MFSLYALLIVAVSRVYMFVGYFIEQNKTCLKTRISAFYGTFENFDFLEHMLYAFLSQQSLYTDIVR